MCALTHTSPFSHSHLSLALVCSLFLMLILCLLLRQHIFFWLDG